MVMKKILFIVAALFVVNSAFSQEANYKISSWGIKAGGNLSSMSDLLEINPTIDRLRGSRTEKDGSGKSFGFHAGVFTNINCGNIVSFQPELLFSVQEAKHKRKSNGTGILKDYQHLIFKFSYVQLPLLFEIKPIANFGILIGPQLGLNVSRKVTATYFDDWWNRYIALYGYDIKKSVTISGSDFDNQFYKLKKLDAAMVFGVQYTIQRVIIGARYNLGLVDGVDFPTGYGNDVKGWKSNVIQASLGFSF